MFRQGRLDASAVALTKAAEANPDYGEAHLWLGEVREAQHRDRDAVEQYKLAFSLQPSLTLAQFQLARILTNMGREREAIPYLRSLLSDLSPEDSHTSMVMVLLGESYGATGEHDQARQFLEQARNRVRTQGPPELLAEIDQELGKLGARAR